MDKQLVKYLTQHESLSLGKLGTFITRKYAANIEPVNNSAYAPVSALQLVKNKGNTIDRAFISFLSNNNDSSESEAQQRTEHYIQSVLKDLDISGEKIINGLGTIRKNNEQIVFYRDTVFKMPVTPAIRVIRQNAVHTLRVGDKEVSNEDMIAYYQSENASGNRRMYWIAGILTLILGVLLAIYYS